MKNLTPLLFIITILLLSCTEEVFVEVPVYDTVYLPSPPKIEIHKIPVKGTLIPIPVPGETDTVYIVGPERVVYDTLKVEVAVINNDTVYITHHHYSDTLVVYTGGSYQYIPEELSRISTEFYVDARKRGLNPSPIQLVMTIANLGAVIQAYNHKVDDFNIIVINDNQTYDEMFIPVYREMARITLGRDYSPDPEHPMYPLYPSNIVRWSNRNQNRIIVDEIFK